VFRKRVNALHLRAAFETDIDLSQVLCGFQTARRETRSGYARAV
jgi:hypothetical protein